MDDSVARRLSALNQRFYNEVSSHFSQTRSRPQPGFSQLVQRWNESLFSTHPVDMLDVGCGEGRFGRFLQHRHLIDRYVGLDFSHALLREARRSTKGDFYLRDLTEPGFIQGLGEFQLISCLALLQHLPQRQWRIRFLRELAQASRRSGHLLLSTWQFLPNRRQRRKIVGWEAIGLSQADVDANDFLLTWAGDSSKLRYVCYIDAEELTSLAGEAGIRSIDHFYADGREHDLNMYMLLRPDRK